MKLASLFAGIGGFDLAAHWMGWETVLQCEINPFAQQILRYYWPDATLVNDITKTDFTPYAGLIDILTGGFPCQPYSVAGQQKGTDDERHLWPHMLRAIREIRPRWVVGENVRGLVSWNGGLVFDQVQSDLEAEGYSVAPFLLPACAVNAPHRRDRIWFVAYSSSARTGYNSESAGDKRGRASESRRAGLRQVYGEACASGLDTAIADGITPDTASGVQQGYEPGERGNKGREDVQPEHGSADTEFTGAVGENGTTPDTGDFGRGGGGGDRGERCISPNLGATAQSDAERCGRKCGTGQAGADAAAPGYEHLATPDTDNRSRPEHGLRTRRDLPKNSDTGERVVADSQCEGLQEPETIEQFIALLNAEREDTRHVTDTRSAGWQERNTTCIAAAAAGQCAGVRNAQPTDWQNFPTQSPVCDGDDGLSTLLDATAVFGKPCKPAHAKPFARWRNESIKGGGNAIVPQVAYQIFQAIYEYKLMY